MALILTRRPGESIDFIDEQTGQTHSITVVSQKGNQTRIAIEAPRTINVVRSEINPANQPPKE